MMEIFGLLDALDVALKKKSGGLEVSAKDVHRCLKDVLNCPEITSPLDGITNSSSSPSPSTSSQQRQPLLSTWAEVFHQRLAAGGTEVLSTQKREGYVKALSDYLDSVNGKTTTTSVSLSPNRTNNNNKAATTTTTSDLERKERTLRSATTLLDYLQTHQQDLHNCLIGLRPSQFVEANSCWPLLTSNNTSSSSSSYSKPPSSSTSSTSSSSLYSTSSSTTQPRTITTSISPPSPSLPSSSSSPLLVLNSTNDHLQQQQSTHHQSSEHTLEGFVQQILTWSELQDKDQLFLEVRSLAESLRVRQLFSPGDLVIASLPSISSSSSSSSSSLEVEGWGLVYGRVVKQVERVVMVNTDPTERGTPKAVAVERVIGFPRNLQHCLGGVQKMKLLVEDSVDVLFSELSHYINTAVLKTISGEHSLLQRISKKKITFEDAEIVKKALEGLESMKKNLEEINDGDEMQQQQHHHSKADILPPYREIESHVKTRIKEFKKSVNVDSLFVVTKTNFREALRGIDTHQLMLSFINAHAEECNSALRALELQRQALRSGSRKRRLKEWWLNYIRTAVVAFLEERDFDFGAMSEHYIDKPPRNVEGVRANLQLVREILNFFETNDRHSLSAWLKQLITHIYKQIDSLYQQLFFLIAEQLDSVRMKNGDILSGLPGTLLSGHVSMHSVDIFLSNSDTSLQTKMIEGLREYANKQQSGLNNNTTSLVADSPTPSGVGSGSVEDLRWMKESFRDLEDILHMKEIDCKPELLAAQIASDYNNRTDRCPASTFLPLAGENGTSGVGSGGRESISELAIHTLIRFENELNTALTLWDNTSQTRQVKQKKLLGFFGNEVLSTLKAPATHFDYTQPPSTSSSSSISSGRSFTSYYSGVGRNSVRIGIGGSRVGSGGVGSPQTSRAYVKKNLTVFFGEAGIEEEIVVLKNNKLSSFFGVAQDSSKPKSSSSCSPPSFGGTVTPNNTPSPPPNTTTTRPNIKSTGTQIDGNVASASLNSSSDWLRKKPSPNRASSPYV